MQISNARCEERISVAPMMGYTNRHARFLIRLMTQYTVLYTEMITAQAIVYNRNRASLLSYNECEDPLILQIGGADPALLGQAIRSLPLDSMYREINFNMGCPSQRVQSGCFGAALMKDKERARLCLKAMQDNTDKPITVKCRIGVDACEGEVFFYPFVEMLSELGIQKIIIHARKAYLDGLDPKQNRSVPPLNYDFVYRVKKVFPHLTIVINGGIDCDAIGHHLSLVDGVMIGRAAFNDMLRLAYVDTNFFDRSKKPLDLKQIVSSYLTYIHKELAHDVPLRSLLKPIFNLYKGRKGVKLIRQQLQDIFQLAVTDQKKSLHMLETCVLD